MKMCFFIVVPFCDRGTNIIIVADTHKIFHMCKNIKKMEFFFNLQSIGRNSNCHNWQKKWNSLFSIVLIAMHIIYVIFYAIQYANM